MYHKPLILGAAGVFWATGLCASEDIADKYPQSELYDKPVQVIPGIRFGIALFSRDSYDGAKLRSFSEGVEDIR